MEKIYKLETIVFYGCLIFLVVLCALGFIAYPAVDDYEYALKSIEKGFWNSQVYEYLNWNGRYLATAILSFNPLTWRWYFGYHLIPLCLIIGLVLSLAYFLRSLLNGFDQNKIYKISVVIISIYLMRHFSLDQNIYWMSGSITYTLPLILELIFFALLYKNLNQEKRVFRTIAMVILTILVIGLNETIMLAHCFLLFMTCVYCIYKDKKLPSDLIILLMISILSSLVVVLAPGNGVRASRFERSHDVLFTLSNSITYTIIYSIKFLSPFYIVLFVFFRKNIKQILQSFELGKTIKFNLWFVLLTSLGLLYVTMAPSLWGMGRRPNDRTLNMVMFLYQLVFPFLAWHIYHKFYEKFSWPRKFISTMNKKTFLYLFVVCFFFYNPFFIIQDGLTKYPRYLELMDQRFSKIFSSDKNSIVELDYLTEKEIPRTIMFKDIDEKFPKIKRYYNIPNATLVEK